MHRNEFLDRHEKSIDDYEKEFKAKEIHIKQLQEASNGRRQQIVDLKEELSVKDDKICDLQDKLANKEAIKDLNLTKKTLFEELAKAEPEEIINAYYSRITRKLQKIPQPSAR